MPSGSSRRGFRVSCARQPASWPSTGGYKLDGVPMRFVLVFLRELATIYIVSGVAVTAIALAVIYGVTRSGANALALAVLAGLWLPLWLAPGIASFTTWRRLRSATAGDIRQPARP